MIDVEQMRRAADAAAKGAEIVVTEAWLRGAIAEIERGRGTPDYSTRIQLDLANQPVLERLGPR